MKSFGFLVATIFLGLILVQPVTIHAADEIRFSLVPIPSVLNCLARFPGDPSRPPTAEARIERGAVNDKLVLHLRNIKPGLAFDLFTVQRSRLLANGSLDPAFTNFGLAWYQSEVQVNSRGAETVLVRTILLDDIFGFDPAVGLAPTNTFHLGFWFDNPSDAAACGFSGSTPFNGDHNAGPLAMISVPNLVTGLGPLCTKSSCP